MSRNQDNNSAADAALKAAQAIVDDLLRQAKSWPTTRQIIRRANDIAEDENRYWTREERRRLRGELADVQRAIARRKAWKARCARLFFLAPGIKGLLQEEQELKQLIHEAPGPLRKSTLDCLDDGLRSLREAWKITAPTPGHLAHALAEALRSVEALKHQREGGPPPLALEPIEPPLNPAAGGGTRTGGAAGQQHRPPDLGQDARQVLDDLLNEDDDERGGGGGAADRPRGG